MGRSTAGRYDRLREIERMDPERDCEQVQRLVSAYEFPWDMVQALGLALFRTFAVPSIGGLLARTGEFTERAQKRYDDTVLLMDAPLEHGLGSVPARDAFRRINAMHAAYGIGNDDLRYVLCTFVVVPERWIDAYGWRPLCDVERRAAAAWYRRVGQRMGIKDLPGGPAEFAEVMDAYEAEHFGPDEGARRVARATLDLMATFRPARGLPRLPRPVADAVSYALMDEPLLAALGLPRPHPAVRTVVRRGVRARGQVVRRLRPRTEPRYARELPWLRTPAGFVLSELGTFPAREGYSTSRTAPM